MILDLRESPDDGHPLPGDSKTLATEVAAKGSRQSGPGNPWIRRRRTHCFGVDACTQAVAADPEELVAVVRHPITEIGRDLILTALEFFIVEFGDESAVLTDEMVVVVLAKRLEAGEALTEVPHSGQSGVHEKLQGAIDCRVAQAGVDGTHPPQQLLDADVAWRARELAHDEVSLTRGLQTFPAEIAAEGDQQLVA
jgi:hypothetical protein